MVSVGLYVRLEAKEGKADELEDFLTGSLELARQEERTTAWYALRFGPTTFAIFDAFESEEGREAHLAGAIAAALMARSDELLASPPAIEHVDVLAVK